MRFSIVAVLLSLMFCFADSALDVEDNNVEKIRKESDDIDSLDRLSMYDKAKTGFILGTEVSFMGIDSTAVSTNGSSLNINGTIVGIGVKLGFQTYSLGFLGVRAYANYKYMGSKLKDSDRRLSYHILFANADALIDIPFNFNNPKHAIGLIAGVGVGGVKYNDVITDNSFRFSIGINVGAGLTFNIRHRIEFIAQFLFIFGNGNVSDYTTSTIPSQTYAYSYKRPINYSIGYTMKF